jgi:hypothetical protein
MSVRKALVMRLPLISRSDSPIGTSSFFDLSVSLPLDSSSSLEALAQALLAVVGKELL